MAGVLRVRLRGDEPEMDRLGPCSSLFYSTDLFVIDGASLENSLDYSDAFNFFKVSASKMI